MKVRVRKLLGVIASLGFLATYCLVAMTVGARYFIEVPAWQQTAFFVVAGVAWLPVMMLLVRWMARPDVVDND
jgi:hypothetical protein